MGLKDLFRPTEEDADEISVEFIESRFGSILPGPLPVKAVELRERVVRMAQYYIWISLRQDLKPSSARDRAMSRVEDEFEDVNRRKLLNAVYDLYEGRAEGEDAVGQFEADLEELALVYEGHEEVA